MAIKDMISGLVGINIGSETIRSAGNLGSGVREATQSLIGIGVIGNAAKGAKDFFKFK